MDQCGADEVVIGLFGREDAEVDRIGFRCGTLTIERSGGTWEVVSTFAGNSAEHGGDGGGMFSEDCSATTHPVVRQLDGQAGSRVDGVRMFCSAVDVTIP